MSGKYLIDVHDIAKTFRSKLLRRPKVALTGVDLRVEEGEIFGFLGPNGAGKTTTIRILLGLLRPSGGSGHLLDRPFGSVDARRELGFLPDAPNFYRYLTSRELLRFTGRLRGIAGVALEDRVEETLERVGLPAEAWDRPLKSYSRGMLQRTGIGATILHRPRLVILDEPMNGLDPLGRHDFRDLILALKKEGTTVFFSSHVLADIETTVDRVGILHGGRLIRCGSLQEILEGDGRGVEIAFELEREDRLSRITGMLDQCRRSGSGWIGRVGDPARGAHVVRTILEEDGVLLGYRRMRLSLEDFFLKQIGADPKSGLPATSSSRFHAGRHTPTPEIFERGKLSKDEAPR